MWLGFGLEPVALDPADLGGDVAEVVVDRPEGGLARVGPLGLGAVDLGESADHVFGGGPLVLGPGEVELGASHESRVGPLEPEEAGVHAASGRR